MEKINIEKISAKENSDKNEYKLKFNENIFLFKLKKDFDTIFIECTNTNELSGYSYQSKYNLESLKKISDVFNFCGSIESVFLLLSDLFKENKINIKEVAESKMLFEMNIINHLGKEIITTFELKKELADKDQIILQLIDKITKIEKEKSNDKEVIKKSELAIEELKKENNMNKENIETLLKFVKINQLVIKELKEELKNLNAKITGKEIKENIRKLSDEDKKRFNDLFKELVEDYGLGCLISQEEIAKKIIEFNYDNKKLYIWAEEVLANH